MILLLVIVLLILLLGGGYGYNAGYVTYGNPLGVVLFIIIILVLLGLFLPVAGYRWYS